MVHYRFKVPNLLELALIIGVALIVVFGFWLILRALGTIPEGVSVTIEVVQTVFTYIGLILLGIIAIILEAIREELRIK